MQSGESEAVPGPANAIPRLHAGPIHLACASPCQLLPMQLMLATPGTCLHPHGHHASTSSGHQDVVLRGAGLNVGGGEEGHVGCTAMQGAAVAHDALQD